MNDFAEKLQARRQADEAEPTTGRKRRSALPSDPPSAGATREEMSAWLNVALSLGADPIANTIRFGRHEDARLVITLKSGTRIVFDRQADIFDAPTLRRRVIIATGCTIPHYMAADVQTIATVVMRLAEVAAEDDDRLEAIEWAQSFLAGAQRNVVDVSSLNTPAGRYEALSVLQDWKPPADLMPYAPAAERAAIVRDAQTGTRIVRTSDLAAHVRGMTGRPVSWGALHSRMREIGWEHRGQVQQRQPGGENKVKARIYAIPGSWENDS